MAGVIKEASAGGAQHFSFKDFEREGQAVLAHAKAQAVELLQAARRRGAEQAKAARAEAYAKGLAEGRQAGEAQIRQEITEDVRQATSGEVREAVSMLMNALNHVEQNKHRLLAQAEQGLLNVAIAIARRVCKHLPEMDPQAAIENCRQALQAVGRHGDLELRVNPDDLTPVREWAADFVTQTDRLENVAVVSDASLERGGCLVRGREVQIDAAIATQLDRIALALLGQTDSAAENPS